MKSTNLLEPSVVNRLDLEKVGPFLFKRLGANYLITNDVGEYRFLSPQEFESFLSGSITESSPLFKEMSEKGFLRHNMNFGALADRWRKRFDHVWSGTSLHIVVVTLRCNLSCVYCQTSSAKMTAKGLDMTEDTARQIVDRIFESPSPAITIELQGGEPLVNWPVVKFLVDYAHKKNETAKKILYITMVTNLSLMDEEKLDFLLNRDVCLCTSLDGPAEVHDKNRLLLGGSSHEHVTKWWQVIRDRSSGKRFGMDGLMTTTKVSLSHPKEIVDEYHRLGARGIYLRSINPFGFAKRTWEAIGYTADEFLDFYYNAMERILEINTRGDLFFEQLSMVFLRKIVAGHNPNHMDYRSPCGAGIGQMAYNYDGSVYTCDEARMLGRTGDDTFKIGHVDESTYSELAQAEPVKTLAIASELNNQPACSSCVYKPYCGVCPMFEYAERGDLFTRFLSTRCRINMGIQDYLFEKLQQPATSAIFEEWVEKAERVHPR